MEAGVRSPKRQRIIRLPQRPLKIVLGLLVLGLVSGVGFYGVLFAIAPRPVAKAYHQWGVPPQKCLECHQSGNYAPLMTHRPVRFCSLCHRPREGQQR